MSFGFGSNLHKPLAVGDRKEKVQAEIDALKADAAKNGLPIDGIVFSYDNVEFARSLGKTSHHFKDGIAYKFGDPTAETVFKHTEWNISRTGQLTPVAVFDPVDIDNTKVERASLHNITFIEGLELEPGDRIIVHTPAYPALTEPPVKQETGMAIPWSIPKIVLFAAKGPR